MSKNFLSISQVADMLSVSKETLRRWDSSGKLKSIRHPVNGYRMYKKNDLKCFEQLGFIFDSKENFEEIKARRKYQVIELFAGAGGLALGLEKAGFSCRLLNDIDQDACATLRLNRPNWDVVDGDVRQIDFRKYRGTIDVITGGFPCQAFSYAGKKLGFKDARGTLFYEFARAVDEVRPLIAVGENVRGLLNHDSGRTLAGMQSILRELGYRLIPPQVLKALLYKVPQKRERLFLVAIRADLSASFEFPRPLSQTYTLRDALKKGVLYGCDVPESEGQRYPAEKARVMDMVPPGGYWRDLPDEEQRAYMQRSYFLGGGKTGMARRMSWDEPSLTLTCAPAQKQTERCHPDETRPFTVREYARIQTFPDDWVFAGSVTSQYRQIGNAVPVNLGFALGQSLVEALNQTRKSDLAA